jgi:hypothetical protein
MALRKKFSDVIREVVARGRKVALAWREFAIFLFLRTQEAHRHRRECFA